MPGVLVALPTKAHSIRLDQLSSPRRNEVEVLPMRAADEILMKSPDALMSGYALEKLIESCVPAIKHPKIVSTPDLDVLLLAIRVASVRQQNGCRSEVPQMRD
jgi:hypothetical protein